MLASCTPLVAFKRRGSEMKVLAIGCVLACGVLNLAHAKLISKMTSSGKTIEVHVYHSEDETCASTSGVVKVLAKPEHGRIANSATTSTITVNRRGRRARCPGTRSVLQVTYTPAPGFRGFDHFSLDVTWGNGAHIVDTYTINVQ